MTVRGKLTLTFGGLAALVLLVAGFSVKALSESETRFVNFVGGINQRALESAKVRTAVDRRAIAARDIVFATQPGDIAALKTEAVQADEAVQRSLNNLKRLVSEGTDVSDAARTVVVKIEQIESAYRPVALKIVDMASQGQHESAALSINNECRPLLAALIGATNDYQSQAEDRASTMIAEARANFVQQRNALLATSLVALLAAIAAGTLITRNLLQALGAEPAELHDIAQRVAEGDLSPVQRAGRQRAGLAERHANQLGAHRQPSAPKQRQHCHRLVANCHGQRRFEPAHRGASQQPTANRRVDGATIGHRENQRRHRRPGQPTGQQRCCRCCARRRGRRHRRQNHARDCRVVAQDGRHHWRD